MVPQLAREGRWKAHEGKTLTMSIHFIAWLGSIQGQRLAAVWKLFQAR